MSNFFNMEGPLFRGLSRLADMMMLNIVFLVCCIPVVTIGASVTAMAYVMLKMRDDEEGYVVRTFWRSFKENFKQSTIIWLLLLVLLVILGLDFYLIRFTEGTMAMAMQVVVYMGAFIWLMVFLYVFPLQSRFYNTLWGTLRNAVLLSLANFPRTFCMMAVYVAAALVTMWNQYTIWYGLLVWFLVGFSAVAWVNSLLMHPVIKKLMPQPESEEPGKPED